MSEPTLMAVAKQSLIRRKDDMDIKLGCMLNYGRIQNPSPVIGRTECTCSHDPLAENAGERWHALS